MCANTYCVSPQLSPYSVPHVLDMTCNREDMLGADSVSLYKLLSVACCDDNRS